MLDQEEIEWFLCSQLHSVHRLFSVHQLHRLPMLSGSFCIQLTGGHKATRNKLVYLALCDLKDNYSCSVTTLLNECKHYDVLIDSLQEKILSDRVEIAGIPDTFSAPSGKLRIANGHSLLQFLFGKIVLAVSDTFDELRSGNFYPHSIKWCLFSLLCCLQLGLVFEGMSFQ